MRFRSDSQRRAVFANINLPPRYSVGFKPETELSMVDLSIRDPNFPYRDYSVALTEMPPDEFLRMQYDQARVHEPELTWEGFMAGAMPMQVEELRKSMSGTTERKVPIPVLLYTKEGKLSGFQEGRKRAVAAEQLGMERIPVIVGVRHYE